MADPDPQDTGSSIKETVISLTISFVFAFVFRGFIVEAFVIPTGSMAPTLMGAHMRFAAPETGYVWPVGPWETLPDNQTAVPLQGSKNPIKVNDPMSGNQLGGNTGLRNVPATAGDRIFVLKYLKGVIDPKRWDVIVFRNPGRPETNFIKRLICLPGEQGAFVDGDLFTRVAENGGEHDVAPPQVYPAAADSWNNPDWTIQRKTELAQKSVWQLVFDSFYAPAMGNQKQPWAGKETAWDFSAGSTYTLKTEAPATLEWDHTNWPILDTYPYNQGRVQNIGELFDRRPDATKVLTDLRLMGYSVFPVSDLRLSANIIPQKSNMDFAGLVIARGHEFRIRIEKGTRGVVEMRPVGETDWKVLNQGELSSPLQAGMVRNIEFWHVDQSLALYIDGKREVYAEYNWLPIERLANATTLKPAEVAGFDANHLPVLYDQANYKRPQARFEFSGSTCTLHHVSMSRDLHYQAAVYNRVNGDTQLGHSRAGMAAAATSPLSTITLNSHEYFCCGDNSPQSSDCRLWDVPDPWVANRVNPQFGVVDERLVIGKAFIVYLPGLGRSRNLPMIDFGRIRWIW